MAAKDITANLPPEVGSRRSPSSRVHPGTLYAGTTDRAVYRGRARGLARGWTWSRYSNGLPFAASITEPGRPSCYRRGASRNLRPGRVRALQRAPDRVGRRNRRHPHLPPCPRQRRLRPTGGSHRGRGHLPTRQRARPGVRVRAPRGAGEAEHVGMLDLLRSAFIGRERVRIDYVRTGLRNGRAFRLARIA